MSDDEIAAALSLLSAESERRGRKRSRFEKARLSKRNKRDPRCPECKVPLMADGHRHDVVQIRMPEMRTPFLGFLVGVAFILEADAGEDKGDTDPD